MTGDSEKYWYNLKTGEVEKGYESPAIDRAGPFETAEEAARPVWTRPAHPICCAGDPGGGPGTRPATTRGAAPRRATPATTSSLASAATGPAVRAPERMRWTSSVTSF